MKKYTLSPVAIIAYVVAGLLFVDFCVSAGQTVSQVNEYYAQYGLTPGVGELLNYVLQNTLTTIVLAFLAFLGGYTLSQVWKLNPDHVKVVADKAEVAPAVAEVATEEVVEEAEAAAEEAVEEAEEAIEKAEEAIDAAIEAEDVVEEAVEAAAEKAEDAE